MRTESRTFVAAIVAALLLTLSTGPALAQGTESGATETNAAPTQVSGTDEDDGTPDGDVEAAESSGSDDDSGAQSDAGQEQSDPDEGEEDGATDPEDGDDDQETPEEEADGAFTVDDALFRWGINNESNNRGAAPGTFNFFSAGKLADPGAGGLLLTQASNGKKWANGRNSGYINRKGKVRIEKARADGTHRLGDWDGTKTDKNGKTLGGYAVNTDFSDHQVVIDGGTGEVDPDTKNATISWKGSFTVVYYSGYSFFYVSDPTLSVKNGKGTVTATLGGYASSMDDMTKWDKVPDRKNVVIADLGTVDLSKKKGFTVTPRYENVKNGRADQVLNKPNTSHPGSFPRSFVDFVTITGAGPYWYSSGGQIDKNKPPLDLAVSYDAKDAIIPPSRGNGGAAAPNIDNSAPAPPNMPAAPAPQSGAAGAPVTTPPTADAPKAGATLQAAQPVATTLPAGNELSAGSRALLWWLSAIVLVAAGLVTASPFLYAARQRP